jgi:hypothetical protein
MTKKLLIGNEYLKKQKGHLLPKFNKLYNIFREYF